MPSREQNFRTGLLGEPLAALWGYLESDERTEILSENGGSNLWVNELGIYNLIHSLSNPVARRLKQWLREEAMPSMRQSFAPTEDISPHEALAIAIPILVTSLDVSRWL